MELFLDSFDICDIRDDCDICSLSLELKDDTHAWCMYLIRWHRLYS